MTVLKKSIAALAAAAVLASSLTGCLNIRKIENPGTPTETLPPDTPVALPSGGEEPETDLPAAAFPAAIDEELLANAVALTVAGNGTEYLDQIDGLWNVIGCYAALNGRVTGEDPWLSEATCGALQRLLRPYEEAFPFPERWLSADTSRETRDGVPGYLFSAYTELLDNMLGVWRELSQTEEDGTRIVEVKDHLDDRTETLYVYIAFATNPESGNRENVYLVVTDPIVETAGLDFTIDLLREQNRMSTLLSIYESVTLDHSDEYSQDAQCCWLRDGDMVFYESNTYTMDDEYGNAEMHSESGWYRGFDFNVYLAAEPTAYLWVSADEVDHANAEYYDNTILGYLPLPEDVAGEPVLLDEGEDWVTFGVTENADLGDGTTLEIENVCTVDKYTLALRSISWNYISPGDGSPVEGGFTVSYNGEKLGEEVMKDWDSLRTVTFDIRSEGTPGGQRTEKAAVPDGWFLQLLADEGLTVYYDESLTDLTYNYIDADTGDITLYVRDEANTVALPADLPGFAFEDVLDANYITLLTKQYGQVALHEEFPFGKCDSWYFRVGDAVVEYSESEYQYEEGPVSDRHGTIGDMDFTLADDGSVLACVYPNIYSYEQYEPDDSSGTDFTALQTDRDGELYFGNTYLIGQILGGTMDQFRETDDGYAFRVTVTPSGYDPTYKIHYACTVEKSSLRLLTLEGEEDNVNRMEYGEDLTPFDDVLKEAMKDTRTLTYHITAEGETYDFTYEVPASWCFTLGVYDMAFYKNANWTGERKNFIPADGADYEIWVTDVMG